MGNYFIKEKKIRRNVTPTEMFGQWRITFFINASSIITLKYHEHFVAPRKFMSKSVTARFCFAAERKSFGPISTDLYDLHDTTANLSVGRKVLIDYFDTV